MINQFTKGRVYIFKKKGKWIIVMSTRDRISRELLERAKYIDLRKLKQEISQ